MKKISILLAVLILFSACGKAEEKYTTGNTKLDTFMILLAENYGFECKESICTLEEIEEETESYRLITFDFKNKKISLKEETDYYEESYNVEYDFLNVTSNLVYSTVDNGSPLKINAILDNKYIFTCTSDKEGWKEEDNFNTCDPLKTYIIDFINLFNKLLEENNLSINDIV